MVKSYPVSKITAQQAFITMSTDLMPRQTKIENPFVNSTLNPSPISEHADTNETEPDTAPTPRNPEFIMVGPQKLESRMTNHSPLFKSTL